MSPQPLIFPNAVQVQYHQKPHDQLQASNSFKILFALENSAGFHEFLDIWYDLAGRNLLSCIAGCISNAICLDDDLGLFLVVLGINHKATQLLDEWECTKAVPIPHVFTSELPGKKAFAQSHASSVGLSFIFLWAML